MDKQCMPSMDTWMEEARKDPNYPLCGMFLFHNGIVRSTPKAQVRFGEQTTSDVKGMDFSYDAEKVAEAEKKTLSMPGIYYVRTWLNRGRLQTGDPIMLVLIGGDIRPRVVDALNALVGTIKDSCVREIEIN